MLALEFRRDRDYKYQMRECKENKSNTSGTATKLKTMSTCATKSERQKVKTLGDKRKKV